MITVVGYSGCSVQIVRGEDNEYIVEKSTSDPNYVIRLLRQRDKQAAAFLRNTVSNVSVPRVLYTKMMDGDSCVVPLSVVKQSVEVDTEPFRECVEDKIHNGHGCLIGMKFIHHTDAVSYLAKTPVANVVSFTNTIMDILQMEIDDCDDATSDFSSSVDAGTPTGHKQKLSPVPIIIITNKLNDIVKTLKSNKIVSSINEGRILCTITDVIIPYLVKHLEQKSVNIDAYGQCILLPLGTCHGDLTLSNILVVEEGDTGLSMTPPIHSCLGTNVMSSPKSVEYSTDQNSQFTSNTCAPKLVLIDFLDSFLETPLVDFVKLYQDLKYGWTFRVMLGNDHRPQHQQTEVCHRPTTDNEEIIINRKAKVNALKAHMNKKKNRRTNPEGFIKSGITLSNQLRVFSAMEYIFSEMEKRFSHFDWYKRHFILFFIINQLRVLQYSKDVEIALYIYASVEKEFEHFMDIFSKKHQGI